MCCKRHSRENYTSKRCVDQITIHYVCLIAMCVSCRSLNELFRPQESSLGARQAEPDVPGAERQGEASDQPADFYGDDGDSKLHASVCGGPAQQARPTGTTEWIMLRMEFTLEIKCPSVNDAQLHHLLFQPPKKSSSASPPSQTQPVRFLLCIFLLQIVKRTCDLINCKTYMWFNWKIVHFSDFVPPFTEAKTSTSI